MSDVTWIAVAQSVVALQHIVLEADKERWQIVVHCAEECGQLGRGRFRRSGSVSDSGSRCALWLMDVIDYLVDRIMVATADGGDSRIVAVVVDSLMACTLLFVAMVRFGGHCERELARVCARTKKRVGCVWVCAVLQSWQAVAR